MRAAAASLIVLTLIGAWGCSGGSPNRPTPTPTPQPQPQPPTPPTVSPNPPAGPSTPPPSPRLAKARFVAFGDSLTEGVVSSPLMFMLVDIPSAYPARLATALRTRYYDQTDIVVLNEGKAGEFALDGKVRLPDVTGVPDWAWLLILAATAGIVFTLIERRERRARPPVEV